MTFQKGDKVRLRADLGEITADDGLSKNKTYTVKDSFEGVGENVILLEDYADPMTGHSAVSAAAFELDKPKLEMTLEEPKIDDELVKMGPDEAYRWLLTSFKAYMHNKLSWIDVKTVFANANAILARYDTEAERQKKIASIANDNVMRMFESPDKVPTVEDAKSICGIDDDTVDLNFGVVLIEPSTHIYAIRLIGVEPTEQDSADPPIGAFGP